MNVEERPHKIMVAIQKSIGCPCSKLPHKKIVSAHLGDTETKAYDSFLDNLIRLVTDLKETEQRIQLGEEQLIHLNDNLVTSPPPPAASSSSHVIPAQ